MLKKQIFIFIIFLILGCGILIRWILTDNLPLIWDEARHLRIGLEVKNSIISFKPWRLFYCTSRYPPFYYLLIFPFLLFNSNPDVVALFNLLPWSFLIFSTYYLARTFLPSSASFIASLVTGFCPFIIGILPKILIDLTLTSIITFSVLSFILSKSFNNKKWSLILGTTIGLGLLTREVFILFIVGPFIWLGIKGIISLYKQGFNRWFNLNKKQLMNSFYCICIAFCLAGPWYIKNINRIIKVIYEQIYIANIEGDPHVFSLSGALFYIKNLIENQFFFPLTIFLFIGLIFTFIKRRNEKWILLQVLTSGYIILTLFKNKDPRYSMPLLPIISIIATHWVIYLKPILRKIAYPLIAIYLSMTTIFMNFKAIAVQNEITIHIGTSSFRLLAREFFIFRFPKKESWPIKQVLGIIKNDLIKKNINVEAKIGLAFDHPFLNTENMLFYAKIRKNNFKFIRIEKEEDIKILSRQPAYILTKTKYPGTIYYTKETPKLLDIIKKDNEKFVEIKHLSLPDDSMLVIYRVNY